jgi:hypothetical protein
MPSEAPKAAVAALALWLSLVWGATAGVLYWWVWLVGSLRISSKMEAPWPVIGEWVAVLGIAPVIGLMAIVSYNAMMWLVSRLARPAPAKGRENEIDAI